MIPSFKIQNAGTAPDEVLCMKSISKSFGGIPVLINADLSVKRGEVHGLMGENGAGKSTLMKILAGIHQRDKGWIFLKNKPVMLKTAHDALSAGISMIHQELNPIPDMTIAENIFIGREPVYGFGGIINRRKLRNDAQQLLDEAGIAKKADACMRDLSIAEMQMVEIVKAVSCKSEIIIMDEPSSSLSQKEVERLFAMIADLKSRRVSVIYISHRMDEVFAVCDTITVLRDGRTIVSGAANVFNTDSLVTAMVGRKLTDIFPKAHHLPGETVLEIKNLSKQGSFTGIHFGVRKGEILGIAGLAGAGRTPLMEAIFGIDRPDSGEIIIHGRKAGIRSPADAISYGMAMVTDDRKQKGLYPDGSVCHNITLSSLNDYCRFKEIIDHTKEKKIAGAMIQKLGIKVSGQQQRVAELSGGNQQKLILARWLLINPEILILDEPTRGIDIGAKAEIYKLINALAFEGKAIIMVSSEMPEILGLCDRILVMCNGHITANMSNEDCTQEKIMQAAMDFEGTMDNGQKQIINH